MDQSNKWSVELQLHWTSSLINLTIRVPHLHFTVCFGVAGWPWYKIHYFLSASVPSNSPSAWYITTDSCDLGSNAVLRFHTLWIHLLLVLVAPGTLGRKSWLEPVKITASLTMWKIIANDSGINSEVDPERRLLNNQKTKQLASFLIGISTWYGLVQDMKCSDAKASKFFFKISISFWQLCIGFYVSTSTWVEAGI